MEYELAKEGADYMEYELAKEGADYIWSMS